jgi:integrase
MEGIGNSVALNHLEGSTMLLADFFNSIYVHRPRVRSPRTIDFYRDEIRKLNRYSGYEVALEDLTEALILQSCHGQIKEGRTYATVQKHQTAIQALWAYAFKKRKALKLRVAPLPEFERWPKMEREPECWSLEELARIVSAAKGLDETYSARTPARLFWPGLILSCYYSGARITQLMYAKWSDYNGGVLLLRAERSKDRSEVRGYFPAELQQIIEAMPRESELIFGAWPHDWPVAPKAWPALNRQYAKIIKAAGLISKSGDKFHRLRKTFATLTASKLGVSVAQTLLGHSSQSVTKRYIDREKVSLPKASEFLPSPLGG